MTRQEPRHIRFGTFRAHLPRRVAVVAAHDLHQVFAALHPLGFDAGLALSCASPLVRVVSPTAAVKMTAVVAIRTVRRHWLSSFDSLSLVTNATKTGKPRNGGTARPEPPVIEFPNHMNLKDFATLAVLGAGALWGVGAARAIDSRRRFRALTIELEDSITMPVLGKLVGGDDPERVGHRQGQRDTRRDRRFAPLLPAGRLRAHPYLRQEDEGLHDLPRLQRLSATTAGSSRSSSPSAAIGNGINGFKLDPDYAKNGKFYTTHMEDPSIEAPGGPQNTMFPGLNTPATRRPRRLRRRDR